MKSSIVLPIFCLMSSIIAYGQNIEPLDLAKRIFSKNYFMDNSAYITGEYTGQPNGFDIGKNSTTKFRMLHQDLKESVVNMTILDSNSKGVDTYLYFTKDSVWKMYAFRALAMTGLYEQMKYELETHPNDNSHVPKFRTKEEYEFTLGNINLTLELDDNIIAHFEKNKAEFERLKGLTLQQLGQENDSSRVRFNLIKNQESRIMNLNIRNYTFHQSVKENTNWAMVLVF